MHLFSSSIVILFIISLALEPASGRLPDSKSRASDSPVFDENEWKIKYIEEPRLPEPLAILSDVSKDLMSEFIFPPVKRKPKSPKMFVRLKNITSRSVRVSCLPIPTEDDDERSPDDDFVHYMIAVQIKKESDDWSDRMLVSDEPMLDQLEPDTKYVMKVDPTNSIPSKNIPFVVRFETYAETNDSTVIFDADRNRVPDPPVLKITYNVTDASKHKYEKVRLSWRMENSSSNGVDYPPTGFIAYQRKTSFWKNNRTKVDSVYVPADASYHDFEEPFCGTDYEYYVVAYNQFGESQLSNIERIKTKSMVPLIPSEINSLLTVTQSSAIVHFDKIKESCCSQPMFMIKWNHTHQQPDYVGFQDSSYTIRDLEPETSYNITITAVNAGIARANITFTTASVTEFQKEIEVRPFKDPYEA